MTPAQRASAISLETAVEDGLVDAAILSEGSSLNAMALLLTPKVTSQPWIRVDSGLWAEGAVESDGGFVSYQTTYVRVPKDTKYRVSLPHVRIRSGKSEGIRRGTTLGELEHEEIRAFFDVLDLKEEQPDWKIVQVATWALSEDVSYHRVRPSSQRSGLRGNLVQVDAGELTEVTELLAEAGHPGDRFAFWSEALDVLDEQAERYDQFTMDGGPGALDSFKQVAEFYPFEIASDVVIGAFDRHPGPEGVDYRRHAIQVLGRHGGARELEVLEQRSRFEDDEELFDQMMRLIAEVSAKPIK